MIVEFLDYLRGRLGALGKIGIGILIFLLFLDVFVIDKHHAHLAFEHLPGFWSLFGFGTGVVIIIVAKWFGRQGIRQKEDYYD